jgi:hypothetical protein
MKLRIFSCIDSTGSWRMKLQTSAQIWALYAVMLSAQWIKLPVTGDTSSISPLESASEKTYVQASSVHASLSAAMWLSVVIQALVRPLSQICCELMKPSEEPSPELSVFKVWGGAPATKTFSQGYGKKRNGGDCQHGRLEERQKRSLQLD